MYVYKLKKSSGFTLVESLIAIGIFSIVTTGIYFAYSGILDIFSASYLNLTALAVLDSEIEIVRNISYSDLGIQGGSPAGILLGEKSVNYGNIPFLVKTFVRNVDDPFDGTQGGNPNDTAPADYKLVEIEITCPTCPRFLSATTTTTVAPPGLETITNNGTLIVKAFNASGQPIAGANVSVINNNVVPAININDITDSSGILRLIDVPPGSANYAITVTKAGYSTDRTYLPGSPSNPNPLKPHATVLQQQITEISFVIDQLSTISFRTQNKFCANVGNIDFTQTGQKLIGTNPNVYKYSATSVTNSSGDKIITGLEFDTYNFVNQDANFDLGGFSPVMPLAVDPNGNYNLSWLMEQKNPSALVVTVEDQNDQTINDAKVTLSRTGFSEEIYSGRKFELQTDWSSGQYDSKTVNLANNSPAGDLTIAQINGKYATMSDEFLISQTIDLGTGDTDFYGLDFNPTGQPAQTSLKIQLASNNDNSTWNFIGPDGTGNSFYVTSGAQINSSHNDDRYIRYKIILRTDDESMTPSFQDVRVNFHSACIPDGQAYFSGLAQNTYTITVEKAGYQTYTDTGLIIDQNWEDYRVNLSP